MSWFDDWTLDDLFPWLDDEPGAVFPIEMCEGCGWGRSFCNCGAPWPIGRGG